jgi:hypothetical protein
MITTVNWQYILLYGDLASGYRVKRRKGGSPPPVPFSGTKTPMADNWVSDPAPSQIHYDPDNRNYIFVFWSLVAYDAQSLQSAAQIQTGNVANDSHTGGQWTITANAYYIWDFGGGNGYNALLIDAFDVQLGDFIPDDFVDVKPDPKGTLTIEANNGYIDTSNEIAQGQPPPAITVTARDLLPHKQFGYWLHWPNTPLFYAFDPKFPPTVGTPNSHDIVVHYNDVVVAIALYHYFYEPVPPPNVYAYNPWWWIESWRGHGPDPGPWARDFAAALVLAEAANRVSPSLRAGVLKIALQQISNVAAEIEKQIKTSS